MGSSPDEVAVSAYEQRPIDGPIKNIYGKDRRLKVARWSALYLAEECIEDTSRHRTWVKQGIPPSAKLVDATIERAYLPHQTNICMVVEDDSFDPVSVNEELPEINVILIDVKNAVAYAMESESNGS